MKTVKITVMRADIRRGKRVDMKLCPIAIAIRRATRCYRYYTGYKGLQHVSGGLIKGPGEAISIAESEGFHGTSTCLGLSAKQWTKKQKVRR